MKCDYGAHLMEALQEALYVYASPLILSLSKEQQSLDTFTMGSAIRRPREQGYHL